LSSYAFSITAEAGIVRDRLAFIKPDTANGPDENVGMCGGVGYATLHADDIAAF
jgi:hypothetical protein